MTHIHLNILLDDVLESVFRHLFYGSKSYFKIKTIGKAETAFSYILITDDASQRIQALKQIMMYLLKTHCSSYRNFVYIPRLIEKVRVI